MSTRTGSQVRFHQEDLDDEPRRTTLGTGPCPGGPGDFVCDECGDPAGEVSVGAFCPRAQCPGTIKGRYKGDNQQHLHDFDGGSCWRCGGFEPGFGLRNDPHLVSHELLKKLLDLTDTYFNSSNNTGER